MPWKENTKVSLRLEFCHLANKPHRNFQNLCRQFKISTKTGYKWLKRFNEEGRAGLVDRSRKPINSPTKTQEHIEKIVMGVRESHRAWGGKKIHAYLTQRGQNTIPHPNTINRILKRNGYISKKGTEQATAWKRFEYESPNDCWQMDFKGYFTIDSKQCHPLDILDDHSRFCLCLQACSNERKATVQECLIQVFRQYGLPLSMLMDNGPPWGNAAKYPHSMLSVWLMRLGIRVMHGRPRHPQTQGKLERFHRTLKVELLQENRFHSFKEIQHGFDQWRDSYNLERPHEAVDMKPPITRYSASTRTYPEKLPPVEYLQDDDIYKINLNGMIQFKGKQRKVTRGLCNEIVAVRQLTEGGQYGIYYGSLKLREIDLSTE